MLVEVSARKNWRFQRRKKSRTHDIKSRGLIFVRWFTRCSHQHVMEGSVAAQRRVFHNRGAIGSGNRSYAIQEFAAERPAQFVRKIQRRVVYVRNQNSISLKARIESRQIAQ